MLDFESESEEVRFQILAFGLRLMSRIDNYEDNDIRERGREIITYGWKKLKYDKNYYIRERARLMMFMYDNQLFDKNQDFIQTYEQFSFTQKEKIQKSKEEDQKRASDKQFTLSVYAKVIKS